MSTAPAPPTSNKLTDGPVHAVPCPWCGRKNDCRGIHRDLDTGAGMGSGFEKGATMSCDGCGNLFEVVKVVNVPIIQVKQRGQQIRAIAPVKR